uniref:HECT domain-containing protein n=1 Tax=Biomphalaria glabrata TaxID=6526 RepID=A0A2C9LR03_BIOGL
MHGNYNHNIPSARRRISRIRCLQDCITSLRNRQPFPDCLCYIPSELEYTTSYKTTWKLLQSPDKTSKVIKEIQATPSTRLIVGGEDFCNGDGKWLCVLKVFQIRNIVFISIIIIFLLQWLCMLWEGVIEEHYAPVLKKHKAFIVPADKEAVDRLKALEKNWTLEHDAALVQVMSTNIPQETENLGSLRGFVEALGVSSYSSGDGESANLTDDDPNTYWETDGQQGQHWIRLTMKKGTIIKSLSLLVNLADDNYLPETIVVVAGEADDVKVLNSVNIVWSPQSNTEIKLLENLTEHYSIVTIRIKSCKSHGIDTRIRGIKLHCLEERSLGFDQEFFSGEKLVRYPLLQSFSPSVNYRRSVVLQRFMWLLDSVIHYLIPAWQSSIESCHFQEGSTLANLESIRQLLPLSKKRLALIDTLLKGSASDPSDRKIVYINRHAAFEHRVNPSDYNNTVFMQLYEGLKPRDRASTPLTYRWSSQNDQWWECKFISEGIIDQGGGFRDSLSDMAEELCPSDPDAPMALPFFVRTPNQSNEDGNVNRDSYIPNPSCHSLEKYEWLGQLMGACFRGKEILILSLPPYVWKRLAGESYNWSRDFATVDAAEVRLIDSLVNMDRETFLTTGRSWTMVLSDGSHVSLKVDSDGNPLPLAYEDRLEYAEKVREIRLAECDKQLKALRSGLLKVIPEAVLELLTWQELETRICGEPEISVEALMKNTFYHHIDEDDLRVKYFWTAVKNFSNEDRSHLLRFITGRRRLPVSIFISSGKNSPTNPLPESSTCCNTLHLPVYTDEKIAEERLRYAAYNCVSIDTDE